MFHLYKYIMYHWAMHETNFEMNIYNIYPRDKMLKVNSQECFNDVKLQVDEEILMWLCMKKAGNRSRASLFTLPDF